MIGQETLPVSGGKGITLYEWKTSSGKVWKYFGDKETHSVYKGDVKNGEPNGLGIMNYFRGTKYVGEWENGKRNGLGTYTYLVGWSYVGSWKNDKRNGQGTETYHSGSGYFGKFRNDKKWNGTEYDSNGKILHKVVNGKPIEQ